MNQEFCSRRAISPLISSMLIIVMAVIGGTITFVFAQELTNSSQVSGYPEIEFFQIHGFDARDTLQLRSHLGKNLSADMSGPFSSDGKKGKSERIIAYIQNMGVKDILIKEMRLGGIEFHYFASPSYFVPEGFYSILTDISPTEKLSEEKIPKLPAGRDVIIVFSLEDYTKLERSLQLKITTSNENVIVKNVITGRHADI